MIKKIIILLTLIITIGFGIIKFLTVAVQMEWGHYFSFENEIESFIQES